MTSPEFSFIRYLIAKKSIDDRALNPHVWESLAQTLPAALPNRPLQILEVGAGIGTMIERMLAKRLIDYAQYTAIDAQADNIAHARQRLPEWCAAHGYQVSDTSTGLRLEKGASQRVSVDLEAVDLFEFVAQNESQGRWDLLIASAFLDLVDVPTTLPFLFDLLESQGLFYFSLNFDGETILEPPIDSHLDRKIVDLYHRSMDERLVRGRPSGDSQAGRHLFTHVPAAGGQILDAGSSDWVVFPTSQGYRNDEAYFLHFIIETITRQLQGHAELQGEEFQPWVSERHAQIDRGELVYIAHQLDLLGRVAHSRPQGFSSNP